MSPNPAGNRAPPAWKAFAEGSHFGAGHIPPPAAPTEVSEIHIITALIAGDIEGDEAADAYLRALTPSGDPATDHWLAVEQAYFNAAGDGGPSQKWEQRADRLSALAGTGSTGQTWTHAIGESRRALLHAICEGRRGTPDFDLAGHQLDIADDLFATLNDRYGLGMVQIVRGRLMGWQGVIDGAAEMLSSALAIFASLGNQYRIAEAAYELGGAYRDLRRYASAEPLHRLAVSINAEKTAPAAQARALQALAATLMGLADDPEEDKAKRLAEAATHAETAYRMSTQFPDDLPKDTEFTAAQAASLQTVPGGDSFRAAMAAMDLCEIHLRQPGARATAEIWFERACAELRIDPADLETQGRTIFGDHVTPGYRALVETEAAAAQSNARSTTNFSHLRLAQLEARLLPAGHAQDAGIAAAQLARIWEARGEAPFAVEAFAHAADTAEEAALRVDADTAEQRSLTRDVQRWRFLALRRAESISANTQSQRLSAVPVPLNRDEMAACEAADVTPLQMLGEEPDIKIFRGQTTQHFNQVRLTFNTGVDRSTEGHNLVSAIARLSRDRPGLPRILRYGVAGDVLWLVDEVTLARPLIDILRGTRDPAIACTVLSQLAHTMRALHDAGAACVLLDPLHIVVEPGEQPVLIRYGPLLTQRADQNGDAALYTPGKHHQPADDVRALARLAVLWLGGTAYLPLSRAKSALERRRFWLRSSEALDRISSDLAVLLKQALADGNATVSLTDLADTLHQEAATL